MKVGDIITFESSENLRGIYEVIQVDKNGFSYSGTEGSGYCTFNCANYRIIKPIIKINKKEG